MTLDPGLRGKVAVVTGGNHGIGAAIAKAFAAQGAHVFLTYKRLPLATSVDLAQAGTPGEAQYALGRSQSAEAVLAKIRAHGGEATAFEADLSDVEIADVLFERAEAAYGPVNILVNNAAHWEASTFIPQTQNLAQSFSTQWMRSSVPVFDAGLHNRAFAVNARAVGLLMTTFTRRLVERGGQWGRVINVSTDGAHCFPSEVTYGASKAALEAYSRSAAAELGQFGITVNVVSPGPIQTGYITPEMEGDIRRRTPLGRVGYPEDIADVVLFLASEQARWVTGQTIRVNGGHSI